MNTAILEQRPTMTSGPSAGPRSIQLHFLSVDELQRGLDAAVESLIDAAMRNGKCGILVTRHQPGHYTVALDESVPFGETIEDIVG